MKSMEALSRRANAGAGVRVGDARDDDTTTGGAHP
jgi:hypothetical protein